MLPIWDSDSANKTPKLQDSPGAGFWMVTSTPRISSTSAVDAQDVRSETIVNAAGYLAREH